MIILITIVAGATVAAGIGSWLYVESNTLLLQTTTSMNDTGFLDQIVGPLYGATGIHLRWVSAGTGASLAAAGQGNGDLVIVHSASAETEFTNHSSTKESYSGKGIGRVNFAYNYFVLVGPVADPAGVNATNYSRLNGTRAFHTLWNYTYYGGSILFASRGDQSGTHNKENSTWTAAGKFNMTFGGTSFSYDADVTGKSWYKSLGKGMGDTLVYANEVGAYTLTDYGTWLAKRDSCPNLALLMGNAADLKNTYSVISVDPDIFPSVKFDLVKKFYQWFLNNETGGMKLLNDYKIDSENVFTLSYKCDVCRCGQAKCMAENGEMHTWFPNMPLCPAPATSSIADVPTIGI